MHPIVLYCKSYRQDVLRVRRLLESIARHNEDRIPVFVSAPPSDLELFREVLAGLDFTLIDDLDIVRANPRLATDPVMALPGRVSQQIVKSEFWRLNHCQNYLLLDSDSYFIRSFGRSDFLAPDGHPYTVMHEAKELRQYAALVGRDRIVADWKRIRETIMSQFGRQGRVYDFLPTPVIWSRLVWDRFDREWLAARGRTLVDAIVQHSDEAIWYGEAYLHFRPFPLYPVEPLFKCYHYEGQFWLADEAGEDEAALRKTFLGVVRQSAWERELDLVQGKRFRRAFRRSLKRFFRRY